VLRDTGHRRAVGISMALLGVSLISLPFLGAHLHGIVHLPLALAIGLPLLVCAFVYCVMGYCRAVGGVVITSTMMELVPKHFMGRVQNTFYFAATLLQFALSFVVGAVAHKRSLAEGFAIVGTIYLLAFLAGAWPVKAGAVPKEEPEPAMSGTGMR
jgi:MFS family permease